MSRKVLTDLDLAKNSLNNAKVQNLASDPSTPTVGQIYFNTGSNRLRTYNGTTWDETGTSSGTGDFSSNTATSVDSEIVLFSSTGGKTGKRATGTGIAKITSGVLGTATAGTDYVAATTGSAIQKASSGNLTAATEGTDYYGPGGTDVAVTDGGTGRSTGTTAYALVATGITATGAQQTLANGATTEVLVGGGAGALPVWTTAQGSGAPVRATSPTLTTPNLGTPTSVTLTNGTGLPQSGVTSLTSDLALKAPLASPTFTGTVTVPTPSGNTDAATKGYVDAAAAGIDWKASVRAATTATGTLATAYANASVIDGVTLATGDRILLKNQSSGSENGIYVVAASGAPTRATDADVSAEVTAGMAVFVEEGTNNADTGWLMTNNGTITLNTTALVFTQFTSLGQVTAGNGLTQTGSTIDAVGTTNRITVNANDIDISSSYVGQTSITTLGTIATGTWNGTIIGSAYGGTANGFTAFTGPTTSAKTFTLPNASATVLTDNTAVTVAQGGTGSGTAAGARTNLGATTKYTATIGDNSTTAIAVTHSLGTSDSIAQVRDASTNAVVECDITNTSTTVTTFTFNVAPATNAYKVTIIG